MAEMSDQVLPTVGTILWRLSRQVGIHRCVPEHSREILDQMFNSLGSPGEAGGVCITGGSPMIKNDVCSESSTSQPSNQNQTGFDSFCRSE